MIDRRDMLKVSSVAAATAIMEGANIMANGAPLATDYSGVREYIGARYVPVFANPLAWSDQREYEPLTIVTYQGNSYTSMQYVPTGIDIGNTAFWALTGNYNAQVEAYRNEVNQYQQTVEGFDDRITENATDIDTINVTLENIQSKPILLIFGDSWTQTNVYGDWISAANVAEIMNCEIKNFGVAGASFVKTNDKVITQIETAVNTLTADESSRVKYVLILAGVNDFTGINPPNGFSTAVNTAFTQCYNNWPNSIRVWAPSSCAAAYDNYRISGLLRTVNSMRGSDSGYNKYIIPNCLPYFWVGHSGSEIFQSDNLHLKAGQSNGARAFGQCILIGFGFGADYIPTWNQILYDNNAVISFNPITGISVKGYIENPSGTTGTNAITSPLTLETISILNNAFSTKSNVTFPIINSNGSAFGYLSVSGSIQSGQYEWKLTGGAVGTTSRIYIMG